MWWYNFVMFNKTYILGVSTKSECKQYKAWWDDVMREREREREKERKKRKWNRTFMHHHHLQITVWH